jgi:hypothetical protein
MLTAPMGIAWRSAQLPQIQFRTERVHYLLSRLCKLNGAHGTHARLVVCKQQRNVRGNIA